MLLSSQQFFLLSITIESVWRNAFERAYFRALAEQLAP
jgi:hypothetical protein